MPTFSCGVEESRTNCSSGVVIFNPFLQGGQESYFVKFHPKKKKQSFLEHEYCYLPCSSSLEFTLTLAHE